MSYRSILRQYPDSLNQDQMHLNGWMVYYNGLPTIRKKTELAREKVSGVMIWQLLQDNTLSHCWGRLIESILEMNSLERFDITNKIPKETIEEILTNHKTLKASMFTAWDWENNKMRADKQW